MLNSFIKLSILNNMLIIHGFHYISLKVLEKRIFHYSILFFLYILALASFAQERIFLDEQIRFSSKNNNIMYVIPLIYRISSSSSKDNFISITRLHRAFQSVIMKHSILRTALYLDSNGTIIQHCLNENTILNEMKPYEFSIINLDNDNDCEIDKTI